MTLADTILAANKLPLEKVEVAEWGTPVWVKTLCVADKSSIEDEFAGTKPKSLTFRQRVLCKAVCDEAGQPVFSSEQIGELRCDVAERLFEAALRLNGWSKEDRKVLEDAEKN